MNHASPFGLRYSSRRSDIFSSLLLRTLFDERFGMRRSVKIRKLIFRNDAFNVLGRALDAIPSGLWRSFFQPSKASRSVPPCWPVGSSGST